MSEQVVFEPLYLQRDARGVFRVGIPRREVAELLGLRKGQRVRVLVDAERRRFIYEVIDVD